MPDPTDGNYVTLSDIRSEGVTSEDASDSRCTLAIKQAERKIEAWTNRWFYRRSAIDIILDGGKKFVRFGINATTELLMIPVPILAVTAIEINAAAQDINNFIVYKRIGPPYDDRQNPRIISKFRTWPTQGLQNIKLTGDFGFVEDTTDYLTPIPIITAAKKLTIRLLDIKKMTGSEGEDREFDLNRSRIQEEEIPGYRYAYGDKDQGIPRYSGDTEIDAIVDEYGYKRFTAAADDGDTGYGEGNAYIRY